jgi:hypothetical protein
VFALFRFHRNANLNYNSGCAESWNRRFRNPFARQFQKTENSSLTVLAIENRIERLGIPSS